MSSIQFKDGCCFYLIYACVFSLIVAPLFIIKKELPKRYLSWIFLALSLVIQYFSHITDLTGTTIFIISLSISIKSKKSYIIYLSMFLIIMLYKFNMSNMEPSQMIAYLSGVIFCLTIYQHYIHPKSQSKQYKINYLEFPSKKYLLDVMQLYIQDKTWDEIAGILYPHKTGNSLRKDVKRDINKLEFGSYAEFVLYLGQNGIIKAIDKNVIT